MTMTQQRKQAERQARRRRIQTAARGVFAEKGYAKTSIEQIARQANLSVGAIYLYFRSKEDLYVSLLEETLDGVNAELNSIRVSETPRLRDAWSYLAQWATTDVEATRVLRQVCQPGVRKQLSDEVAEGTGRRLDTARDHLSAILEAGVARGEYRGGDTAVTVDTLWALFLGLLQQTDARTNLGVEGPTLAEAAHASFGLIEATLKNNTAALRAA